MLKVKNLFKNVMYSWGEKHTYRDSWDKMCEYKVYTYNSYKLLIIIDGSLIYKTIFINVMTKQKQLQRENILAHPLGSGILWYI